VGNEGIFRGILKVCYKRVALVKNMKCSWSDAFYGTICIFWDFTGFSAQTVLGIVLLKSGLLGDFFSVCVGHPASNKKSFGQ
jgi:hypothetical protein